MSEDRKGKARGKYSIDRLAPAQLRRKEVNTILNFL
jgi:hypothetical protein